jgi:hypothetical protein
LLLALNVLADRPECLLGSMVHCAVLASFLPRKSSIALERRIPVYRVVGRIRETQLHA